MYLLESKKKSFLFLVGIAGEMRGVGSSFRGRERSKSYSTGGEGEAGIINQAEDRETRMHGFFTGSRNMFFDTECRTCFYSS